MDKDLLDLPTSIKLQPVDSHADTVLQDGFVKWMKVVVPLHICGWFRLCSLLSNHKSWCFLHPASSLGWCFEAVPILYHIYLTGPPGKNKKINQLLFHQSTKKSPSSVAADQTSVLQQWCFGRNSCFPVPVMSSGLKPGFSSSQWRFYVAPLELCWLGAHFQKE